MTPTTNADGPMKSVETYRIGELSTRSGLTPDALRYYERLGLLPPPRRTSGGFRVYTVGTLETLRFIRRAQSLGLTLHEIGALVGYQEQGGLRRCREVRDLLHLKLGQLEARAAELEDFRNTLSGHLAECERTLSQGKSPEAPGEPCCPVIENLRTKRT